MTPTEYRDKVKKRLSIPSDNDEFDTLLEEFASEVVENLYPVLQKESAPEEVSLTSNSHTFDLPEGKEELRRIEYRNHSDDVWLSYHDHFIQHDRTIILSEGLGYSATLRLYCTERYGLQELPAEYTQVIINWMMSEFYSLLVGNKRKYNIYMQSSGARGADSMRDLSDYYLDRGNQILMDRATVRGN